MAFEEVVWESEGPRGVYDALAPPAARELKRVCSRSLTASTVRYLGEWLPRIESAIEASMRAEDPHGLFSESMPYLFRAGGKRIRGVVAIATCELTGGDPRDALGAACAMELLHTSSLILDDLPCMDDAASRRGVPALHREFDEATAILSALMLFNLAHEQLAQPGPVSAERARERHHFVFKALGGDGVIGGQCADLMLRAGRATAGELSAVHIKKTSSLMAAALVAGALSGRASTDDVALFASLGELVGRVYQLTDDALDTDEDPSGCAVDRTSAAPVSSLGRGLVLLRTRYPELSAPRQVLEDVASLAAHREG